MVTRCHTKQISEDASGGSSLIFVSTFGSGSVGTATVLHSAFRWTKARDSAAKCCKRAWSEPLDSELYSVEIVWPRCLVGVSGPDVEFLLRRAGARVLVLPLFLRLLN